MGLSRICFCSLFIFISGLNDRSDDLVTEPAVGGVGAVSGPLELRIVAQVDLGS